MLSGKHGEVIVKVYVFRGRGGAFGFTQDASGSNLPSEPGPWKPFNELDMERGERPRIVVNTDEALDDIEKQGYHLQGVTIVLSEGGS